MKYITIDGDDVGQRIADSYLRNDVTALSSINALVNAKTTLIAEFLLSQGFVIIFRAADGVAGFLETDKIDEPYLFEKINEIAGADLSFSVGVGSDLRESFIALLSAKSSGKARLHNFEMVSKNV